MVAQAQYNWKKEAAAKLASTSGFANAALSGDEGEVNIDQIEKAFCDQAYGFVANKAGPLMADPFRIGFEIVYNNDSYTRLVGVFAFRIGASLLYAPVFFINGDIKGTDLLYRVEPKTFVPLNEDWVQFLIERNHKASLGESFERSLTRKVPNFLPLRKIAWPPRLQKIAHTRSTPAEATEWESFFDSLMPKEMPDASLTEFLEEQGQPALTKLASLIDRSPAYLELIFRATSPETILDENLWDKVPMEKQAASEPLFKMGIDWEDGMDKSAAESLVGKGYWIDDRRPEEVLSLVTMPLNARVTSVEEPGIYNLIMADGMTTKALACGYDSERYLPTAGGSNYPMPPTLYSPYGPNSAAYNNRRVRRLIVLEDGRSQDICEKKRPYGELLGDISTYNEGTESNAEEKDINHFISDKMEPGKFYRIFDRNAMAALSGVYRCHSAESIGENTVSYKLHQHSYMPSKPDENVLELIHNKDSDHFVTGATIIGKPAGFIPVKVLENKKSYPGSTPSISFRPDEDFFIGDESTIDDWIANGSHSVVHKVAVAKGAHDRLTIIENGHRVKELLTKAGAIHMLCRHWGVQGNIAAQLVDSAIEKGTDYALIAPGVKTAATAFVRIPRDPVFITHWNSDFGAAQFDPQEYAVKADQWAPYVPPHRIHDAYKPTLEGNGNSNSSKGNDGKGDSVADKNKKPIKAKIMPKTMGGQTELKKAASTNTDDDDSMPLADLLALSPDQIASVSKSKQLPKVLDHGIIGHLVNAMDVHGLIDQYIPKLEEGTDALGRLVFTFYWKPKDYEKLYGTDDMNGLEMEMLSSFKAIGKILLDLMKKSQQSKDTSTPIT